MRRVLVLGSSGSGKTTVAGQLGDVLGLEVIHLDSHYWQPNWVNTPSEEWIQKLDALLRRDRWVMDGNYTGSLDLRLKYADAVVFIDLSRVLCLWRCVKRLAQNRGRNRRELAPGCYEKMDWEFFQWIWNYSRDIRPIILERLENLTTEKEVFRLQSTKAVRLFLEEIQATRPST